MIMDEAIMQLYYSGMIDREMAIQFATDPDGMEHKIIWWIKPEAYGMGNSMCFRFFFLGDRIYVFRDIFLKGTIYVFTEMDWT